MRNFILNSLTKTNHPRKTNQLLALVAFKINIDLEILMLKINKEFKFILKIKDYIQYLKKLI